MKHRTLRASAAAAAALLLLSLLTGCAGTPASGKTVSAQAPASATAAPILRDEPDAAIEWQDSRFEACVRALLELPDGDVYPAALARVTSLCFYGNAVCRTTDDAYRYDAATDSVSLGGKIYACQPMSLADAAHFPALETLCIHGGGITGGLDALSSLPKLEKLSLTDCGLGDLSFLSACGGLSSLDLSGNPIADASPIAALAGLTELSLAGTAVADVSALGKLPLTEIDLTGAPVADYAPLSPATRLLTGVQVTVTAALAYGERTALPAAADGTYNFGARTITWTSSDPDTASVKDGFACAGTTQFMLGTGTYACAVTGQVENSDAELILLLTVGNGKTYAEKWGSRVTLARSVYGYPKSLTPRMEACTGFSLVSRQTAVKGDPFSVDWQIWIKENNRTWKAVHTFRVTPGEYQYFDVVFDTPTMFSAVSVAPAEKLSSANTYNGGFELYCLRFAPAA